MPLGMHSSTRSATRARALRLPLAVDSRSTCETEVALASAGAALVVLDCRGLLGGKHGGTSSVK
eukprot:5706538-Pleurochrysis_carterae.AAC.5